MAAYREAAKGLLKDRYQSLAENVPEYLRLPCNITVLLCPDGMIVRYDIGEEGKVKVRSAAVEEPLNVFAPRMSDGIIHFPDNFDSYDPGPAGPSFGFEKVNLSTGERESVGTFRPLIYVSPIPTDRAAWLSPPHRPPAAVSMTNELEFVLEGEIAPIS